MANAAWVAIRWIQTASTFGERVQLTSQAPKFLDPVIELGGASLQ